MEHITNLTIVAATAAAGAGIDKIIDKDTMLPLGIVIGLGWALIRMTTKWNEVTNTLVQHTDQLKAMHTMLSQLHCAKNGGQCPADKPKTSILIS